jgi:uncharacterized protein with PQ loop repeat
MEFSEQVNFANLLRFIVIALACFSFYTIVMVLVYFTRRVKTNADYRIHKPLMKDLSVHVYLVSFASIGFCVYGILEMLTRVNQVLTWRSPVLIVVFAVFAAASYKMFSLQSELFYKDQSSKKE